MNYVNKIIQRINKLSDVKFRYPYPNKLVGILELGDGYSLKGYKLYSLEFNGTLIATIGEEDSKKITLVIREQKNKLIQSALENL